MIRQLSSIEMPPEVAVIPARQRSAGGLQPIIAVIGVDRAGAPRRAVAAGLLLVISAAISHDLIKGIFMPTISEKRELLAGRIAAAVAILIAGYLGFDPPGRVAQVVAFAFGLLHGLGFAGALSEIGLPQSEIPIALLFFNIGVEIGQLIFVAVVLILEWFMHQIRVTRIDWVRALPAYIIGVIATYWFIERTLSIMRI